MKSREEIAKKYFPCTCGEIYLSRNLTAPDCAFHSLEWDKALEEYAQQSQPSGMRCEPEFIEYINKSRAAFVKHIHGMKWDAKFRTAVDDLLICFDKMKNRLSESSPAGAAEGASEGMAGAVKFAKFLADNDYHPGSGNKHWFKWNGMEVDETPLTLEQVYKIFASLSPGVEDGSGWVKVEDGLPEMVEGWSRVEYMTIIKGYTGVWVGKIFKSSFGYSCTAKTSHDIITHWRPLPTPPGVEDNQTKKQ